MCKSVEILARAYAEVYAKSYAVEKLLRNGKTPKEIADFCDYDLAEVEEIEQSLVTATE